MRKRLLVVAALALLVLAGCGGDDDDSDTSSGTTSPNTQASEEEGDNEGSGELVDMKLAIQPLVDYAPILVGIEQGFFEEEGIALEPVYGQGGAVAIPTVMSGDAQIGGSNVVSVINAFSEGLDIRVVAPGVKANKEYSALVVPGDSDIQSASDLAGKTVSVNTFRNIGEITLREALSDDVDVDSINFTEVGFGDALAALDQGQIDAAWLVEPFVTQAVRDGARVISYNFEETEPELQVAVFFANGKWADDNPDLVEAFQRAYKKSVAYATENPDAIRTILPTFARIDEATAKEMSLPIWPDEVDRDSVEAMGKRMVDQGVLSEEPDWDTFFGSK